MWGRFTPSIPQISSCGHLSIGLFNPGGNYARGREEGSSEVSANRPFHSKLTLLNEFWSRVNRTLLHHWARANWNNRNELSLLVLRCQGHTTTQLQETQELFLTFRLRPRVHVSQLDKSTSGDAQICARKLQCGKKHQNSQSAHTHIFSNNLLRYRLSRTHFIFYRLLKQV